MLWDNIIGQEKIKSQLQEAIKEGRISHAQLFAGPEGSGALMLAIAYAEQVLCGVENQTCHLKMASLQHPDLHFSYPISSTESIKEPHSKLFLKDWREFVLQNPYSNSFDWMQYLGIEKKQGIINVKEANEIVKSLALNSYEGGYKIMIIWMPESMRTEAANKLLKIIEEPPQKTLFLLVTEREDLLLPTITSRCQLVKINRLTDEEITQALIEKKNLEPSRARHIAHQSNGNWREALQHIDEENNEFDAYFVQWVRNAFIAAKKPAILREIIQWSTEISGWSREKQKQFLVYCSDVFRQALLKNYHVDELVFMEIKAGNFKWEGFSPFIHGSNIEEILDEINEGIFHIERNANPKILFLDLAIKLTRYIHKKSA